MAGHYCYSNREYVDMIKALGACYCNAHAPAILYAERFPRRRHPDDKVITRVKQRLVDTGHLNPRRGTGGRPLSMSWQEEEQVLDMVADQPGISTRALARRDSLPKTTVHTCLQRYSLYPCRPQQVQALQPGDRRHRLQYCRRLVERVNEDADFVTRVLWTDESHFTQMGIVNTHNIHHWAKKIRILRERESVRFVGPSMCGQVY
jgi:hypothetical protein